MAKKILLLLLIVACFILLSGCNTIHGMGKDIQKLGEVIKDAAD